MNTYQDKAWDAIEKDLQSRGETIVSGQCFAAIFMAKIKTAEGKRKTVMYYGADELMEGYRDLKPLLCANGQTPQTA